PCISLVQDELVQRGDRRRLLGVTVVFDGAQQSRRRAKSRVSREEVGDLEIRVGAGLEPPEDFENGLGPEYHRRVALLGLHSVDRLGYLGKELGQQRGGPKLETAVAPAQRAAGTDLLHQRGAERGIVEGVGDRRFVRRLARPSAQRMQYVSCGPS